MTNLEAAAELERVANICTTTKLSIAAMMGANLLRAQQDTKDGAVKPDCGNCRYADRMPSVYPCSQCVTGFAAPSNWKSKGV